MDHRDEPRAEELHSLRLALATFALRLDGFEARFLLGIALTCRGKAFDVLRNFLSGI